ncbi:chaperonin 10-like protein [Aspergillus insuetus]
MVGIKKPTPSPLFNKIVRPIPTHRRVIRRTDDFPTGMRKTKLVSEPLPTLSPTSVLVKVHAVTLNYRDANIANGGNSWPVVPNRILGNDAAGEVIAVGDKVRTLTIVFDERVLCKLPRYLSWEEAAMVPCAGITAWSALKGMQIVQTVLIQGAAGLRIILASSSDAKLQQSKDKLGSPPISTFNYAKTPNWDQEVLRLTNGVGVNIVVDNGGTSSLVKSLRCTRGGVVGQVGYPAKQDPSELRELIPTIIDRRVILRGINAGSKSDMENFCAALEATQMPLGDLIDKVFPFEQAEQAVDYVWQGKQIGKIVLRVLRATA